MNSNAELRLATLRDLEALAVLESEAFATDRFSMDQIEYLVSRAHATILVIELDNRIVGAAYMLWRRKLPIGRVYNIAVSPAVQGKGYGARLLDECELEAARRNCTHLSLEVRQDNNSAIAFYKKHEFDIAETLLDYYEDGSAAYKMLKPLKRKAADRIKLKMPYYGQTQDFTCGPASLMMAFKYHRPEINLGQRLELMLWKEATLVFMTSGIGGTDPFGLALAARRRGFQTRVILSREQTPFFSSVRIKEKRKVIQIVHEDLKNKTSALGVPVAYYDFPFEEIAAAMYRERVPIVLISTYRLTGERAPHWVVVTGFDRKYVYFNDPDIESYDGKISLARNVKISIDEFGRMRRYGKDLYKSVIFIGPPMHSPLLSLDGNIIVHD